MRAEARAHAAVAADYWFFCLIVEIYRAHNTGVFAFAAADALFRFQQYAAASTLFKSFARTYLHAGRFLASKAHDCDKARGHASGCTHLNRAFYQGMIRMMDYRTDAHARETSQAFVHFFWLQYFRQFFPLLVSHYTFNRLPVKYHLRPFFTLSGRKNSLFRAKTRVIFRLLLTIYADSHNNCL